MSKVASSGKGTTRVGDVYPAIRWRHQFKCPLSRVFLRAPISVYSKGAVSLERLEEMPMEPRVHVYKTVV